MSGIKRRTFVAETVASMAAAGLRQARAAPNEIVNVAVLGCGHGLARWFSRLPDSQVVAICDPDQNRGGALSETIANEFDRKPESISDFRRLLDRQDIDALVVATPDHWHAPVTIHACLAGKDVYVEKPCSHNILEGRLAVIAARKHKRIVQHGTQLRSAPHYQEAWQLVREGVIGKPLMVKAINNQRRGLMPHREDSPVPVGVDYDLWLGPAPARPFNRNHFHGGWHWLWNYGTGDLGNDGVHQVDLGRWALGLKAPPCGHLQRGQTGIERGRPGDTRHDGCHLGIRWAVVCFRAARFYPLPDAGTPK